MPLPDSAPEKWGYKEHTRVKHQILSKYISGWLRILGSRNKKICFIDGFAGRGIYEDGSPGSPIIVMKTAEDLHQNFTEFVCVNVENNPDNFICLEQEIDKVKLSKNDLISFP